MRWKTFQRFDCTFCCLWPWNIRPNLIVSKNIHESRSPFGSVKQPKLTLYNSTGLKTLQKCHQKYLHFHEKYLCCHDKYLRCHDKYLCCHDKYLCCHDEYLCCHDKYLCCHDRMSSLYWTISLDFEEIVFDPTYEVTSLANFLKPFFSLCFAIIFMAS